MRCDLEPGENAPDLTCTMPDTFEIVAKTLGGLEDLLAEELTALGAQGVHTGSRLVRCRGDQRLLYSANLWCRTAIRLLRPIHAFQATNESELYQGVQAIDWRQYLDADSSLAIDPIVRSSFCTHSLYAAQLAKDAIVDQFRDRTGRRPSVDLDDPGLRIHLYMYLNQATIYVDSSGDSLHLRGYRAEAVEAPMNEVLAAAMVRLSGWDGTGTFFDPMCGSGTLVIEAAQRARNIAPGLQRRFAFERWKDYDRTLHAAITADAQQAKRESSAGTIVGSDCDEQAVAIARQNVRRAGLEGVVPIEAADFFERPAPPAPGTLVMNPPYDERIAVPDVVQLYRQIGHTLKQRYAGYTAFLFTGNLDAARHVGLRTSRRVVLFNGPIECRLLRYEIHASTLPAATAGLDSAPDQGPTPADRSRSSSRAEEFETVPSEPSPQIGAGLAGQMEMFANRLRRMSRHWRKWARRQGITCFRVYDRDIPAAPLAIDLYAGRLHIAEFERPHDDDAADHAKWLRQLVQTTRAILEVPAERTYVKQRRRQRGAAQYARQAAMGEFIEVTESAHRFLVNLADYLDTGLFLDHRLTRSLVGADAAGRRFLNLFGYTGAFTVYAAAGGATATTTVDLNASYLDWAGRNMALNGFTGREHQYVCDDIFGFLERAFLRRGERYDLVVVDPPTFSNSKKLQRDFDVDRDHVRLLEMVLQVLADGAKVYFSTNCRRFHFRGSELRGVHLREITPQTVPPDFQRRRPHRCWTLTKLPGGEHPGI